MNDSENNHALRAGEKVFSIILLLVGCVALYLSINLWFAISTKHAPRISSAAALPLFVSSLWVLLSLWTVIKNFRLKAQKSEIIPLNALVIFAMIIIYCAAIIYGVNFYAATSVFIYASMCYLARKDYLKNIIWTGLIMAFIVLGLRFLLSILLP